MSGMDDLVERLRLSAHIWRDPLGAEAADRIEALDAARMQQAEEITLGLMRIEALERALREIIKAATPVPVQAMSQSEATIIDIARAALKEGE